jgi:hypothetical protein
MKYSLTAECLKNRQQQRIDGTFSVYVLIFSKPMGGCRKSFSPEDTFGGMAALAFEVGSKKFSSEEETHSGEVPPLWAANKPTFKFKFARLRVRLVTRIALPVSPVGYDVQSRTSTMRASAFVHHRVC